MKKVILIIVAVIIIVASVVGVKHMNASKVRQRDAETEKINKEAGVRPKQAEIDDLIRNYRNIYINLINDKDLDFSFLDNVLDKKSTYYNNAISDIKNKREASIKLQVENIEIGEVKESSDGYKVKVDETLQTINSNGKTEKKSGDYIIKYGNGKIQISGYDEK